MRILMCHNRYQQPGGEDRCFDDECRLLESSGHEVLRFTLHNDAIPGMNPWMLAARTIFNRQTYRELRALIRRERPVIMHCTNTFPLISPAAYYAARAESIPVVQSVHNFRLFCCNSLLMRDGRVCEDCLRRLVPWPGVLHGCYRQSRSATAVVASMLSVHRALRTWTRLVDRYVALSESSRRKLLEGGLPPAKIAVKPNFVHPDPGVGDGCGGYAIFVGRLSEEKGVDTLLRAWTRLDEPVPLKIVGDGPLAEQVRQATCHQPCIQWLGRRSADEVLARIGDAACLVVPSDCYENFPRTIAEAFAKATPVIASRLGAMAELVRDGESGLLFTPGDARDLAAKVQTFFADRLAAAAMRSAARREYEQKYTAGRNHEMLMTIYAEALGRDRRTVPAGADRARNSSEGCSLPLSHLSPPATASQGERRSLTTTLTEETQP